MNSTLTRGRRAGGQLSALLHAPVDGGSLAFFRMAMGVVMALEAYSLLVPDPVHNLVQAMYTGPHVHWNFPYHGFEWVRAWREPWMTVHCVVLGISGVFLAVGLFSRVAAALVFLTWTYVVLIESALFNNHYYLMSLLAFLLIWMPSERSASIDRWWSMRRGNPRGVAWGVVPFWTIFLLRGQLIVVYFFAGVTKINAAWLLTAAPVHSQLTQPHVQKNLTGLLGSQLGSDAFTLFSAQAAAFFVVYSGLLFDLTVGFLLLCRRTRILAFLLTVCFHGFNHLVLFDDIGWFPLLGVLTTTIFFDPDWPRRLFSWVRRPRLAKPDFGWLAAGALAVPLLGASLGWKLAPTAPRGRPARAARGRLAIVFVAVWLAIQVVLPLRHFAVPGDVNWTFESDRFSWRMKAVAQTRGPLRIRVADPGLLSGDAQRGWRVNWNAWRGPRSVYRDLGARGVHWPSMPEFFVCFQPFWGERLVYNPWAGSLGIPASEEAARARVTRFWQEHYGRQPRIYPTMSLMEFLTLCERVFQGRASSEKVLIELRGAKRIAQNLAIPSLESGDVIALLDALHRHFAVIAKSGAHVKHFRTLLAKTHPFASEGALVTPARFLAIEDHAIAKVERNFVVIDREKWPPADRGPLDVYVDFARFMDTEWIAMPQIVLRSDSRGGVEMWWNQGVDLIGHQELIMRTRPFMCHQYAQRVAELWEEWFGRRPQVYITNYVGRIPYPMQLVIDPNVDLAAAPIKLLGHNEWILPMLHEDAPDPLGWRQLDAERRVELVGAKGE